MAKYIDIPFAENGDKQTIPATTTDGTVNYTDGFGIGYSKPIGSDPIAKPLKRENINQVLNDITGAVKDLQENGVFTWQSTKSGGYDVGAIVSLNGVNYENTVAANTATPPNNGWRLLSDATLLNGQPDTFYLPAGNYTAADVLAKIKTVDGAGSGLDADLWQGEQKDTLVASLRANVNIDGGGTISWDSNGYFNGTNRFIVIANGRGTFFSTNGYFNISIPTSGTIQGVGGAASVTATSAGIPITGWQALYYILPIGDDSTSLPANFRLVAYSSDIVIPDNWVLIASQNSDTDTLAVAGGKYTLHKGESIDTSKYSSAFVPNADLVRGWDGALVWYSPTLLNSWVNYGGSLVTCQYAKNPMTNEVTIRGIIKGGSNTKSTTIFTLPVGFRPPLFELQIQEASGGYVRTNVRTDGTVECYASDDHVGNANSWMALNIKFIAGQ